MQHRTIQADVLEFKDRILVLKSDEASHSDIRAIQDSFKKHGHKGVIIMSIGQGDSLESLSKDDAIRILKAIAEGPDEERKSEKWKDGRYELNSDDNRADEQG